MMTQEDMMQKMAQASAALVALNGLGKHEPLAMYEGVARKHWELQLRVASTLWQMRQEKEGMPHVSHRLVQRESAGRVASQA